MSQMAEMEILLGIASDLGELKGEVRAMRATLAKIEPLADRITALEQDRSYARGVVAAVSAIVGTVVTLFVSYIRDLIS